MRFLNFTILKLSLGFITGVILGFYNGFSTFQALTCLLILFALLVIFKWVIKIKPLFLGASVLLFCNLGYLTTLLQLPENNTNHFIHLNYETDQFYEITATVDQDLKNTAYYDKYVLTDLRIDGNVFDGKLLLNVARDSITQNLHVGDVISFYKGLSPVKPSKNPQLFDYAAYLKQNDIYAQVYLTKDYVIVKQDNNLSAYSSALRDRIVNALENAGFKEQHINLIQALLLGQKQEIDREMYSAFADVGIVHILAVSGLHVGIIYLILNYVFNLLLPLKTRRFFSPLLVVLSLWSFAILVGLSPSVTRAVTMFTFFALRDMLSRKSNSINVLFMSAVALLLYDPKLIMNVGFQLSYAAVFSILCLYPVFSTLYAFKYKFPQIFLDTAYVSLAAQIGVLPFQLFYFHQFPGIFLLSNMLVIPFLGLLISGGIISIILALVGLIHPTIVGIYSWMLDALISVTSWLSQFHYFILKDIFFTKPMFVMLTVLVFVFMVMIRNFKKTQVFVFLSISFVFSAVVVLETIQFNKHSELIVFHQNKASLVGLKNSNVLSLFTSDSLVEIDDYTIKNYNLFYAIKQTKIETLRNEYELEGLSFSVIDSTGVYNSSLDERIVLLSGSPDFHFEKLLKSQHIKTVIADGSNYKSYVERWKKTALDYGIPFHSTAEKGSFRLVLNTKL
jgi:competence protein ComEC